MYFAINKNFLNCYRLSSYDLKESYETPINKIKKCDKQWANYILGVIA